MDYSFQEIKQFSEIADLIASKGEKKPSAEGAAAAAEGSFFLFNSSSLGFRAWFSPSPKLLYELPASCCSLAFLFFLFIGVPGSGIRLSYNDLSGYDGMSDAFESLVSNSYENVEWIDLSHNKFTTIDKGLCKFTELKSLNLHGNCIKNLSEMRKLAKLKKLRKLSLHGNFTDYINEQGQVKYRRMEAKPHYRPYIIYMLRFTQVGI